MLTPHGQVHLEPDPDGWCAVDGRIGSRLTAAFTRGQGHGLLMLGAARLPEPLPPTLAFWRRLGNLYVARFCAENEPDQRRQLPPVAPPPGAFEELTAAAPAMRGGEYLTAEVLAQLWAEIERAFSVEATASGGDAEALLAGLDPAWHMLGRVCLHLAENKRSPALPFAFLATYAAQLRGGKLQHQQLGEALREYADDRDKLLALLSPVQRAAAQSPFVAELVKQKAIFQPQAWTAAQAYQLLREVPLLQQSGVVVRVPDWWHADARRRSRVTAQVSIGAPTDGLLGADAMLDFEVDVALDGDKLTKAEWRELQRASSGLVLVKGRWVEIDPQQLQQALGHWQQVEAAVAADGLSFAEGMRLLAGVRFGDDVSEDAPAAEVGWSTVVADRRLEELLAALRDPSRLEQVHPGKALQATLRPYQEHGLRWLWLLQQLGLGACLADDMGLGKTLQVIALLLSLARQGQRRASLVVMPASLLANWQAEFTRFAGQLKVLVAHPSAMAAAELAALDASKLHAHDVVLTTYGSLLRQEWPQANEWRMVVLDEAQAIKNPGARQTKAAKALRAGARVALTGTPVENRLSDLWSIFDFLCPGLLGTVGQFGKYQKRLGPRGHAALRELVRPYILRRLKSDKRVIADLPDKTEVRRYCPLSKPQAVLYQQSVEDLARHLDEPLEDQQRRGLVLAFLLRLKQICNHPSQWLGDGGYAEAGSGKFQSLRELCEEIASRQEKVLVFTQFRQIIDPLASLLAEVFGRPGLVLHGGTAVGKRQKLVEAFGRDDGPPFFVLSLKAGGTGLNLTAASHVVHFDRWWNPAVENQATDRAYRIGQRRNVLVHKFVCRGTVEERIDELILAKVALANELLDGGDEVAITELSNAELMRLVSLDIHTAVAE